MFDRPAAADWLSQTPGKKQSGSEARHRCAGSEATDDGGGQTHLDVITLSFPKFDWKEMGWEMRWGREKADRRRQNEKKISRYDRKTACHRESIRGSIDVDFVTFHLLLRTWGAALYTARQFEFIGAVVLRRQLDNQSQPSLCISLPLREPYIAAGMSVEVGCRMFTKRTPRESLLPPRVAI